MTRTRQQRLFCTFTAIKATAPRSDPRLSSLNDFDFLVVDTAAGISDNVTVLFGAWT